MTPQIVVINTESGVNIVEDTNGNITAHDPETNEVVTLRDPDEVENN